MKIGTWTFKGDAEPQGSSNGFWYDITAGGYIKPEELLADASQLAAVEDAVLLLGSFNQALEDADLLNEF